MMEKRRIEIAGEIKIKLDMHVEIGRQKKTIETEDDTGIDKKYIYNKTEVIDENSRRPSSPTKNTNK